MTENRMRRACAEISTVLSWLAQTEQLPEVSGGFTADVTPSCCPLHMWHTCNRDSDTGRWMSLPCVSRTLFFGCCLTNESKTLCVLCWGQSDISHCSFPHQWKLINSQHCGCSLPWFSKGKTQFDTTKVFISRKQKQEADCQTENVIFDFSPEMLRERKHSAFVLRSFLKAQTLKCFSDYTEPV